VTFRNPLVLLKISLVPIFGSQKTTMSCAETFQSASITNDI
jgi:hypothetical protein